MRMSRRRANERAGSPKGASARPTAAATRADVGVTSAATAPETETVHIEPIVAHRDDRAMAGVLTKVVADRRWALYVSEG